MEETIEDLIAMEWCLIACNETDTEMDVVDYDLDTVVAIPARKAPTRDGVTPYKKKSVISLRSPNRDEVDQGNFGHVIVRGKYAISVVSTLWTFSSEFVAVITSAALLFFLFPTMENDFKSALSAVDDRDISIEYMLAVHQFYHVTGMTY